jgi:hypothetical protein
VVVVVVVLAFAYSSGIDDKGGGSGKKWNIFQRLSGCTI